MILRRIILTTYFALLVVLLERAASGQYQADPYSQPPAAGGGFRFGPDPNAPAAAPMPAVNRYQPQPAPPPVGPLPYPSPQQTIAGPPMAAAPMTAAPMGAVPMGPAPFGPPPQPNPQPAGPPAVAPARAQELVPGFDSSLSSPNAQLLQGSELYQPSQIVATVGNQYILYGDVAPIVEQMLGPAIAKSKSADERGQLEALRPRLIQQVVRQSVDTKLRYLEFEREMESQAGRDKMPEVQQRISTEMRETFAKNLQSTLEKVKAAKPEELADLAKSDPVLPRLAILMKENGIENFSDLDQLLRQQYGSSLEKQRRLFIEHNLGGAGMSKKIKVKTEISHLEMLNYYREHTEDFAVKAKARFEILSVKFANFPNPAAAHQAIVNMGNEVYFGTPFAAVARKGSQDPNAANGGVYDWTTENSLASEVVNKAIFTLELGKLSPILSDDRGLHIIRVTERQEAGYIPFTDAQVKIKELITQKRREAAYKEYVDGLKTKTVVWTIYDAQEGTNVASQPGAMQR